MEFTSDNNVLSHNSRNRLRNLLSGLPSEVIKSFQCDEFSVHCMTNHRIANSVAALAFSLLSNDSSSRIVDAMAGVGGNSIAFAKIFSNVEAIEVDKKTYDMLLHNLKLTECGHVKTVNADFNSVDIGCPDLIFYDPPWGLDYKNFETTQLSVGNLPLSEVLNQVDCRYAILKLPVNYDLDHLYRETNDKYVKVTMLTYGKPNSSLFVALKRK